MTNQQVERAMETIQTMITHHDNMIKEAELKGKDLSHHKREVSAMRLAVEVMDAYVAWNG